MMYLFEQKNSVHNEFIGTNKHRLDLLNQRKLNSSVGVVQKNDPAELAKFKVGNHTVWASEGKTSASYVGQVLDFLAQNHPQETTLVISGTHGSSIGLTGAEDSHLHETDFFFEDKDSVMAMTNKNQNTTLVSVPPMTTEQIAEAIKNGSYGGVSYNNVILAFCYGQERMNQVLKYPGS